MKVTKSTLLKVPMGYTNLHSVTIDNEHGFSIDYKALLKHECATGKLLEQDFSIDISSGVYYIGFVVFNDGFAAKRAFKQAIKVSSLREAIALIEQHNGHVMSEIRECEV